MNAKQFIKENKLYVEKITKISENPYNQDWKDAKHYEVVLGKEEEYKRKTAVFYFSMGTGLKGEPKLEDVLYSLTSDVRDLENYSMDEWLEELGYVHDIADIRRGERIYKACLEEGKKLKEWLGVAKYHELLREVVEE